MLRFPLRIRASSVAANTGAALCALVLLSGCVTVTSPQAPTAEDLPSSVPVRRTREAQLLSIADWTVGGRIALKAGTDGWNGSLKWTQTTDQLDFRFTAPLGVASFRIQGDPRLLHITLSSGEQYKVTDPVADLHDMFGWSVPVHSMRYWMLGVPDPRSEYSELLDEAGNPSQLEQRGWVVDFDRYREVDGQVLPRRIVMTGHEVRIRVAVDSWQVR